MTHPLGFDPAVQAALDLKANLTANTFTAAQVINLNTAAAFSGGLSDIRLQIFGPDGGVNRLLLDSIGAGNQLTLRRGNTSGAAPSALLANQTIGTLGAFGAYDASTYTSGPRASISFLTTENWSSTNQGTAITINTTPAGSNTQSERARFDGANFGIAETVPGARLHVQGAASAITEIIRGNATTPGDLTQWQKSDGTVYSGVNSTGGQYGKLATTTKTANYTATTADRVITANKATAIVITLPAATGSGQTISITSIGAGACTVDGNGSETINGETTQVLYLHESITVHDYGSGTWEVI